MTESPLFRQAVQGYRYLIAAASVLRCPLLLVIRLFWGWQFFSTGKGKLGDLDKVAGFFASINIPLPKLNAIVVGCTETFGGLLILVGLGTRLVSLPLIITLCVAYLTADREALGSIFSDPDKFTGATPFLFLFAMVILLAFGPGKISLDALLERYFNKTTPGRPVTDPTSRDR